jgi:hypothetical protein
MRSSSVPDAPWQRVLLYVIRTLGPLQAAVPVGGSCGLLLQGVELAKQPNDIDMYYDLADGASLHRLLAPWRLEAPHTSVTERYRSVLSHYRIEKITIETVGGFTVFAGGSTYRVEIRDWALKYGPAAELDGMPVRLMPLAHELVFNLLRERNDRLEAISRAMRADLTVHLPALRELMRRNSLSAGHIRTLEHWLDTGLSSDEEG